MKISYERELQQIAFNHLSDIEFNGYESLQKMYYKIIFFINPNLASANPSHFRKNLLEII